jgi:hypothetical protein
MRNNSIISYSLKLVLLTFLSSEFSGCSTDLPPPTPQCAYLSHETAPCNEDVVLSNDEGKKWSCKIPNPHYTADDQHCKWDIK